MNEPTLDEIRAWAEENEVEFENCATPLLTVTEVAVVLNVSRAQVYRLRREGLPSIRLSAGALRFSEPDVLEWLDGRRAS